MITTTDNVTGLSMRPETKLSLGASGRRDGLQGVLTDATVFVQSNAAPVGLWRIDLLAEQYGMRQLLGSAFLASANKGAIIVAQGIDCEQFHVDVSCSNPASVLSNLGLAVRDCCGAFGVHIPEPLLQFPDTAFATATAMNAIGPAPLGGPRGQIVRRNAIGDGTVTLPAGSRLLDVYAQEEIGAAGNHRISVTMPDGDVEAWQWVPAAGGNEQMQRFQLYGLMPAISVEGAFVDSFTVFAVR